MVHGFTPLLAAVRYTRYDCVKVLLDNGANMLAKDNERHLTPLLWAVEVQSPKLEVIAIYAFQMMLFYCLGFLITL